MMPWYMSQRYNSPSGPVAVHTGRKFGSVLAMNSAWSYALVSVVRPSSTVTFARRINRPTGSGISRSPRRSAGKPSPR